MCGAIVTVFVRNYYGGGGKGEFLVFCYLIAVACVMIGVLDCVLCSYGCGAMMRFFHCVGNFASEGRAPMCWMSRLTRAIQHGVSLPRRWWVCSGISYPRRYICPKSRNRCSRRRSRAVGRCNLRRVRFGCGWVQMPP